MLVAFIFRFLPVSIYLLPFDSASVYFGNILSNPDLLREMVHCTWPMSAGKGFIYISLSSSSGKYGLKSLDINASYASFYDGLSGAYGIMPG